MKNKILNKSLQLILVMGMVAALAFSLTGCSLWNEEVDDVFVQAEKFIPGAAAVVVEINTLDDEQRDNLDDLKELFPKNDEEEETMDRVIQDLDQKLVKYGVGFKNDIEPIIGEQYRLLVAAMPMVANNVDVYTSLTVRDQDKYDALMTKLVEHKDFIIEKYKDAKIVVNDVEPIYITEIENVAITGNSRDALKKVIDIAKGEGGTALIDNEKYQMVTGKLPPQRFGMLYFDASGLVTSLVGDDDQVGFKTINRFLGGSAMYEALEGEAFALTVEDEGVKVRGYAYGNEEILKAAGVDFRDIAKEDVYLLKDIPEENMVFFVEGYNLKQTVEANIVQGATTEEDKLAYEAFKQNLLTQASIDFERDILTWMDKGYAFAVQDSGSVIPGITLIFDVTSNIDGAKKVATSLDLFLTQTIESMKNQAGPYANVLTKDRVELADAEVNRVTLDLAKVPAELLQSLQVPQEAMQDRIEIYYGVTGDDRFVISTYRGLDEDYGEGFDGSRQYKAVKKYVDGFDRGLMFANPSALIDYVDKFVKLAENVRPLSVEEQENYDLFKQYLEPFKGAIISAKATATEVDMGGFIKVDK